MIRGLIEDYYDIQKMRIEVENQLRSSEQGLSQIEEKFIRENVFARLKLIEKDIYKEMGRWVENEDIYCEWLGNIKGIGPVLATGLVSWIENPDKFATISKLWAYSGLAVDGDGRAVRRKTGEKNNWNARLKTHLWKVGESFVKTKGGYRELYDQFRKEYDEKWKTPDDCHSTGCKNKKKCLDGHRYAAAKRKTVKVFLAHLWMKWREIRGLPVEHPFIIGKNGHSHLIEIINK